MAFSIFNQNKLTMDKLEQLINDDIKQAMLAKDAQRLSALRAVKAAIMLEKTSGSSHELSDADVLKIMQKLVKQRTESAQIYREAGRDELAASEDAEAAVIQTYLPRKMTPDELEAELRNIIAQVGAKSPAEMGKVMGVASKQLAGKADGKQISEIVKKLLANA